MGLNDVFDKGGMMKKKGKREEEKNMGESHYGCCHWCRDSMPIYTAGGKVTSLVCVCVEGDVMCSILNSSRKVRP
ncbi:hypothetical protein Peur_041777 [Populus x canadensis]